VSVPILALILAFSLLEFILLAVLVVFYFRLRRSEELFSNLQGNQEALLARIEVNAKLERELVATFEDRQKELLALNEKLEERAAEMRRLLEQAESIRRSPQFLREIIMNGRRRGLSNRQIAKDAGLSVDEVELILSQQSTDGSV
jgi:CRP-like cAMP-binding protein